MSIALFFITHEGIASNLLSVGESIIQKPNSNLSYLEIPMDANVSTMINNIENKLKQLKLDESVLFITDIFGSTPSNIAQQLATKYNTQLISGVNLPMIIRLLSYRNESQHNLLQKALDGAHQGIQQNVYS
jgi:PTS system mannose-specific IIA component